MSLTLLSLASTGSAGTDVAGSAGYATTLASMIGGLILVLAVIFVLAYVVRRLNLVSSGGNVVRTLAVTPLGQREKLVLAQVGEKQYLLGVTASQITLIDKLDEPLTVVQDSFASRLKMAKDGQK
ncbi:flagellar biosynthetic protein FliO [Shewanella amazonensis]|uniref:Flagellar protein n=1 Tax=Shewanella amazonensis (strain ATCC BAA-1098 / SB2B) TaxID=326297 RepID=A1S7Y7_SHEAM|nr:flagellar protein FliO [Shewanella amazonensis SB2B]